jgi:hypothetical protein
MSFTPFMVSFIFNREAHEDHEGLELPLALATPFLAVRGQPSHSLQ